MYQEVKKALKNLIEQRGKYIVKKDRVIRGYIEDALANYPLYKNISIFLAKEGLLKNLGNTKKLNETELKTYTKQITDKYGTESRKTEETVRAWAEALGISVAKKRQHTSTSSSSQTSSHTANTTVNANTSETNGFFEKLNLFFIILVIVVLSSIIGLALEHILVYFLNKFDFIDIYSSYTHVVIMFLIAIVSGIAYFNHFIVEKNDIIEEGSLFWRIIFSFFIGIFSLGYIIGVPILVKTLYFSDPYTLGVCNNNYSYMSGSRENFKICIDQKNMLILNKEGKHKIHMLIHTDNQRGMDRFDSTDIKEIQSFLVDYAKRVNIDIDLNRLDIKKGKDITFYSDDKAYRFNHIILETKEPIKNFKEEAAILAQTIFDNYSLPDDENKAWIPENVKYLHDFTTDSFYAKHNHIALSLTYDSMINQYELTVTDYGNREKMKKILKKLLSNESITFDEKKESTFKYNVWRLSESEREKLFKELLWIINRLSSDYDMPLVSHTD